MDDSRKDSGLLEWSVESFRKEFLNRREKIAQQLHASVDGLRDGSIEWSMTGMCASEKKDDTGTLKSKLITERPQILDGDYILDASKMIIEEVIKPNYLEAEESLPRKIYRLFCEEPIMGRSASSLLGALYDYECKGSDSELSDNLFHPSDISFVDAPTATGKVAPIRGTWAQRLIWLCVSMLLILLSVVLIRIL